MHKVWYRLYPELRYIASREELRSIKCAFRKKHFRRWSTLLSAGVVWGLLTCASFLNARLLVWLNLSGLAIIAINVGVFAIIGALVPLYFWHWPYIRFLRQYLQGKGVPICLKCGYDLRGQQTPRCPECGQSFDPALLKSAQAVVASSLDDEPE